MPEFILASGSQIRAQMLRRAGLDIVVIPARVDEAAISAALASEGASARDLADVLAETKALRIAARHPDAMVLGADQVLDCEGVIHSKPTTPDEAVAQIRDLAGRTHRLLSAAVVCQGDRPLWRHVGEARLTMAPLSEGFVTDYVARNWPGLSETVGGYKIEEEGVRLMSRIEGDWFTILGLPLLPLLTWLRGRGDIAS